MATRDDAGRKGSRWASLATVGLAILGLVSLSWPGGDPPVATVEAATACSASTPGAMDFCATNRCGPCEAGEGDCDPGQCAAGLDCIEEGAVDHCRTAADACGSTFPEAMDFCATSRCGPCGEGEGDCDPGQCAAGLDCIEEGAVDHCRADADGCSAAEPGAMDFCATNRCGPCEAGEGDCDPGQCAAGLDCVEEGAVDTCRPSGGVGGNGTSNLQVRVNGVWKGVCCDGSVPQVSSGDCWWTEADRTLTDTLAGRKLMCPEGSPTNCTCGGTGERMHGIHGSLDSSLGLPNGGPVYPNYLLETCVYVTGSGRLATEWTQPGCPSFRLN